MTAPLPFGLTAPKGWAALPLGRIVTRSQEAGRPNLEPLSVFLNAGVVPRASRDDNFNRLGADMGKYLVVRPGDLVFNKLRTWQGGFGVSPYDGIVSPAYFVCRPDAGVHARFLHHLLRSRVYLEELTRISKWMPPSQFDISWDDLGQLAVLLPSLDEQRAIADYLDRETARIDALIAAKQRMATLALEHFDGEVWTRIVGHEVQGRRRDTGVPWIGSIPDGWGTPTVSANFDVELGKMLNPGAATAPEQYPYLRNTDVQWDRINCFDLPTMTFNPEERVRYALRPGDLLVCEGGEVGRAAIWRGQTIDIYFQKALHRVRARGPANTRFLMYCLRVAAKMNVFSVQGNLSTIVHLTREQLKSYRFPWPPLEDQEQIVAALDSSWNRLGMLTAALDCQIALLGERRQALITAAVTGRLPVPAPA